MNKRCDLCGVLLDYQGIGADSRINARQKCENCQNLGSEIKKATPTKSIFYIFEGLKILFQNSKLIKLSIVPILITLILLYLFIFFGFKYSYHAVTSLAEIQTDSFFINILKFVTITLSPFILALGFLFLSIFLILPISSLVSIPFLEPMCIETEKFILGETQEEKFKLSDTIAMIKEIFFLIAFKLIVLVCSLPLLFIPIVGYIAFLFILTLITSIDFLDIIMARKKYVFKEKIKFIKENFTSYLTFSIPLMVLFWIPILQLLLIPSAAIGATKFFLESEKNYKLANGEK